MTTSIYHLNIYLGKDRKNWFKKEVVNFIENCQLTQLDYCELLRQYDLYESDKDAYFNLIKDYRNLSEILGDEDVTHVYKIFLEGYKKNETNWKVSGEEKNLVIEIEQAISHSPSTKLKTSSQRKPIIQSIWILLMSVIIQ